MRILSLDGGGLRGVYTLEILKKIRKDYGIEFHKYFDIIIGTSTGSIIATMLALGKNPEEIMEQYLKTSNEIFPEEERGRGQGGFLSASYKISKLESTIKEYLKDYSINDIKTKLIIPSVNLSDVSISIFKSYEQDNDLMLDEAVISSSAAPGFFDPYEVEDKMYIDGGIFSNNPSLIGFSEAFKFGVRNIDDIKILSIGTGYNKKHFSKEEISNQNIISRFGNFGGMLSLGLNRFFGTTENDKGLLAMAFPLFSATMKTATQNVDYILSNMYTNKNYVRLNEESIGLKVDTIPYELVNQLNSYTYEEEYKPKLDIFFKDEKLNKNWMTWIKSKFFRK